MGTQLRASIKLSVLLSLAGSILFPSLVRAQDERCSIVRGLGCIDFDPNTTTTLTVPANTTRIERDAVRVCVEGITDTEPVDVVFVVDQSGSMCSSSGNLPCGDGADPDNVAPEAVNAGLDILNTLASNSNATVLRFASEVSLNGTCEDRDGNPTEQTPAIAPVSTNLDPLKTWVTTNIPEPGNNCGGGYTNYTLALSTADSLVRQGPLENKVIIFITDGVPHDPDVEPGQPNSATYDNWTGKDSLVPVHSIYIGGNPAAEDCSDPANNDNPGGRLGCLAYLTGGSYNPINDADELQGVIAQIVNQVTASANINQSVIANTTNGQSNTVTGVNHVEETETRFIANMPNIIALNEGVNTIQVTTSATIGGETTQLSEIITINVEGTTPQLDSIFDLQCGNASQIVATDANDFNQTITSINFNATGFGVQLTSSDEGVTSTTDNLSVSSGDNETYNMTLADGTGQHTVTMSTGGAGPANGNIEVAPVGGDQIRISWVHPQDPRDTASYVLTVTDNRDAVDIVNVWITDQDGDGAGDMVFIQTDGVAPVLPTTIPEINWPGNGTTRTANSDQISYMDGDSTIIVVNLTNNPFDVGATAPDGNPTLTMPNEEPYYGGTTHPIEDRIGAVITEVIKIPSNFAQIGIEIRGDDGILDTIYRTIPDTLVIRTSEPIVGTGGDLIIDVDGNPITIVGDPIRDPNDSLVWRIVIPASRDSTALTTGDVVTLNPNSNYTDANGNTNGTGGQNTGGEDGSGRGVVTQVVTQVVTNPDETGKGTQPNVELDTEIPVVTLDGDTVYTDKTSIIRWIPPHGTQGTSIDPKTLLDVQRQCRSNGTSLPHTCTGDDCPLIEDTEGCMSRIVVVTQVDEGPYEATISVFDHLGKFVKSWEQWWGFCGEATNDAANVPGGIASYLVWDLKDEEANYVGSGVYIIKVTYHFPDNGRVRNVLYKQGVARFDREGQCSN